MLSEMGSREFMEWRAAYQIDQWGEDIADLRNALLCFLVYNGLRGPKSKALDIDTFLLFKRQRAHTPQSAKEQKRIWLQFVELHNRAVNHGNDQKP